MREKSTRERGRVGEKEARMGKESKMQGEAGVQSPPPRSCETGTDRKLCY